VRWKRSSVEQTVAILKPAEAGLPVADLIRWTRISEQTFYSWKKQDLPINSRLIKSGPPLAIYRTGQDGTVNAHGGNTPRESR
jgi:hypothetical protein